MIPAPLSYSTFEAKLYLLGIGLLGNPIDRSMLADLLLRLGGRGWIGCGPKLSWDEELNLYNYRCCKYKIMNGHVIKNFIILVTLGEILCMERRKSFCFS